MDFRAKIQAKQFTVTAEIVPPKKPQLDGMRKKLANYQGVVDAVNITDSASAIVRMSPLATSLTVLEAGYEPIMQLTCRDRNRIALQADLIGAHALGVRNILCLTGDHLLEGDHPSAKPVFDLDSMNLLAMVRRMRDEGAFFSGVPIKDLKKEEACKLDFFIGAAANPFADPLSFRITRLARKQLAGADFIQTQPVFDLARFKRWYQLLADEGLTTSLPIIGGVMPMKSHRPLIYMRDNVPGTSIPEDTIKRMESATDPAEEGVKLCLETIAELKELPGLAGIHIMTLSWEAIVPRLVREAGLNEA
jgi:5,10-methylenetetrahydrofolate reductase